MRRAARMTTGLALIAVLFAWLMLRFEPPLTDWIAQWPLLGWGLQGAAWLCCLGGIALVVSSWSSGDDGA